MIYEINLWLNPGNKYNGVVNINRGEQQIKFSRLTSPSTFVSQGVASGQFDAACSKKVEASLDQTALYAWLQGSADFVIWNPKNAYAELSNDAGHFHVPQNKTYRSTSKYAPIISFRVEV